MLIFEVKLIYYVFINSNINRVLLTMTDAAFPRFASRYLLWFIIWFIIITIIATMYTCIYLEYTYNRDTKFCLRHAILGPTYCIQTKFIYTIK